MQERLRLSEAQRIYGLPDGTFTVQRAQSVPLPEYREKLDRLLADLVAGRVESYDAEFKIRRKCDGEIRDIHSVAEYDASNNRVVGIIRDVTPAPD